MLILIKKLNRLQISEKYLKLGIRLEGECEMRCVNCGKEIEDKSKYCKYCGRNQYQSNITRELPPEDRPQMFNCVECGRPLPVGIDQCIYCNHIYQNEYAVRIKAEQHTGIVGHKGLKCPKCNSDNIKVENDIPISSTLKELIIFGAVLPTTKAKYRKDMVYHCASCGYSWKDSEF